MSAVFVSIETVKESKAKKSVEVFLDVTFPLTMNALDVEILGLKAGDGDRKIGNNSVLNAKNVERSGNKQKYEDMVE